MYSGKQCRFLKLICVFLTTWKHLAGPKQRVCRFEDIVGTMFEELSAANKVSVCFLYKCKQKKNPNSNTSAKPKIRLYYEERFFFSESNWNPNPHVSTLLALHPHRHSHTHTERGHIKTSNKGQLKATVPLGAKGEIVPFFFLHAVLRRYGSPGSFGSGKVKRRAYVAGRQRSYVHVMLCVDFREAASVTVWESC